MSASEMVSGEGLMTVLLRLAAGGALIGLG
jgi:hypothetical protein